MNRFLKYINLAVATLCIAAGTVLWWYGYRVLAKTSGTVTAPVAARITVTRDARGVPRIQASSIEDALFAQGYVTAQDRLFQMEFVRRQEGGTLAEIFGRVALESDVTVRRMRLRRVAEEQARILQPEDARALAAYARGVNYFLATHSGAYAVEFALLKLDPEPWTLADSILVSLAMFRSLTHSYPDELLKQSLLENGEPEKVRALLPVAEGFGPAVGSNAWVLAGSRTKSGKPLLASDPHLRYSLPGLWYQVHLKAPGLNVAGVSLPGLPGVIIGHNDRVAWGMTNLGFDVQDLYEVRLNPARGLYLDNGRAALARQEREVVRVRGSASLNLLNWSTRIGPVVLTAGSKHYALRWTANEGPLQFPVLDINRAGNWKEFTAALSRFTGPAQNFVYADVDGNIGYRAAGRLPARKAHDGDLPLPPEWTGEEWSGFIPFEEMPSAFNPPSGLIVTANQNPFPSSSSYRINGEFAPGYRARQIQALLEAGAKWGPADMPAVQKDVYSAFHHYLAKRLVEAARGSGVSSPLLSEAVPLLERWNGQMEIGEPAALLATLAFQHLRKAMVERATPDKPDAANSVSYAAVARLLRLGDREWFADWDQLLRRVLLDAAEEAGRMQGRDPRKWDYGRVSQVALRSPVAAEVPVIGKYFQIGPVAMSGAPTTVKQLAGAVGPSMRFVADLSAWDQSLMILTTGQSGQPLSSHFKDQWDAYYVGQTYPMLFEREEVKDRLELVPRSGS